MNFYKKILHQIDDRRNRLSQGKVNAIPYGLENLDKYLPGITRESQTLLTTVSGGGKTTISTNIWIQNPFDFWLANKDKMDFDFKAFLFCLEDSAEMTMKRFMLKALWKIKGIRVDMYTAECYYQDRTIDDEVRRAMADLEPYFETFLSKVELLDIRSPTGISKHIKKWLKDPLNGNLVDEHGNKLTPREIKERNENFVKNFYKPTNDNRFVINLIDNMQNVGTEKEANTKWLACDLLTRRYLRDDLCGYYKCTNVIIAQQEKSKEKAQYKADGDIVVDKYIPTLDSISEYKNVTDTCHLAFGLFGPYRYDIPSFQPSGSKAFYDITRLGDFYRNLAILKANFAGSKVNTSLLFDGITGTVSELPNCMDTEAMNKVYAYTQAIMMKQKGLSPLNLK